MEDMKVWEHEDMKVWEHENVEIGQCGNTSIWKYRILELEGMRDRNSGLTGYPNPPIPRLCSRS